MIRFFEDKKDILAVMSERKDGSMKLLGNGNGAKNRDKFFIQNKINGEKVFAAEMVHGNGVAIVDEKSPQIIAGTDALVTKGKLFLAVTVADCVPVYFYDEKNKIVGLAHAGWRGIAGGIIKNTLDKIIQLGGEQGGTKVTLGPGIRKCHFEIKKDIVDNFKKYLQFIISKGDKLFVDIFGIIKEQLLNLGIKEINIFDSEECTFENKKQYFSYRRDKPEVVEVMMAMIGMRNS